MRAFAAAWPEGEFVHQAGAQLPWRHVTVLLDRLDDPVLHDWYAGEAVEHGWSRKVLGHQISSGLHARVGAAPSNSPAHLPAPDSGSLTSRWGALGIPAAVHVLCST